MKNMLIRVCLLVMIAVLALNCTALGEAAPDADPALDMAAEVAAKVDFTQYPEAFSEWNIAYLKMYLRDVGIMENNSWVFDITEGDLNATGASAGVMYIDMEAASAMDMIFFFDVKEGEAKEAALQTVRDTQAITPDVEGAFPTPMDAMLGGFCFSYTMGMDEDHMTIMRAAIYALANHFEIEPDFIFQ